MWAEHCVFAQRRGSLPPICTAYVCARRCAAGFGAAPGDGVISQALRPLGVDGTGTSRRGQLVSSSGVRCVFLCAVEKEIDGLGKTLFPQFCRDLCV